VIVPDVVAYLGSMAAQVLARNDLPEGITSLLGDALGSGCEFDQTRQQLSIYCDAHFGDLDPKVPPSAGSAIVRSIASSLPQLEPGSPAIDLGCSVGRASFELARHTGGLVLGVDLNFAMLRIAQRVLRRGQLQYDRRRVGLVYDRQDYVVKPDHADAVDFWACDLLALPFPDGAFACALGLNVLDCVSSPLSLLEELARLLQPGSHALLSTPYDWSAAATPAAAWLGGHSQRGPGAGASEAVLRALLGSGGGSGNVEGLVLERELADGHWSLRLNVRARMQYETHQFLIRRI
jgi:SAM-dependent methyltransferase